MRADVRHLEDARKRLDALPTNGGDWRSELFGSAKAGYTGDERNVLIALRNAPELAGLVRFNDFGLRVEFARAPPWRNADAGTPWTDVDDTHCSAWLQAQGLKLRGRATVSDSIGVVAHESSVHPVRSYLEALKWDGEPRLQIWLAEFLNAEAAPAYLKAVGAKFLISAVARIFEPGCQVDHVLVFEGPQGIGKSQTARALAVNREWFTDDMPDIHSKDAPLQLCGRWIVELAELAALRRTEIEGMKAFITRPTDVYRPPYAHRAIAVQRQSVFLATTNEAQYLRDPTGNRRFWPVTCGAIDVAGLTQHRDQLWAEAVSLYRAGAAWHLTEQEAELAADEQRERLYVTELEADVADYLSTISPAQKEVTAKEVLVRALKLDPDKPDFAERAGRLGREVAAALQRAGCTRLRTVGRGSARRTLYQLPHRDS